MDIKTNKNSNRQPSRPTPQVLGRAHVYRTQALTRRTSVCLPRSRSVDGFRVVSRVPRITSAPRTMEMPHASPAVPAQVLSVPEVPTVAEIAETNFAEAVIESHIKKGNGFVYRLVSFAAVLLVVMGMATFTLTIKSNHAVATQAKALAASNDHVVSSTSTTTTTSTELPSEDKPTDTKVSSYQVDENKPKYIQIPKLGTARSRVLEVGETVDGAVATPKSVWDAGWYDGSSLPDAKSGSALIVGHVAGPTTGGIFYKLHTLEAGDEVRITMGDDRVKTYEVVATEEQLVEDIQVQKLLVSKNIDKPGLTLMTCGGDFDPHTNTYNKRTIVYAVAKD